MARYIDVEEFKYNINASDLYGTKAWDKVMNILADIETANVTPVVRGHWSLDEQEKAHCSACGDIRRLNARE